MSPLESLYALGVGVVLGLSIAAPPGPVNALIARDTVVRSKLAGFLVGCGALTADAIFLGVTFALAGELVLYPGTRAALFLLGAGVLLFLTATTVRSYRRRKEVLDKAEALPQKFSYLLGLGVGITNPFQILWWLTVGLSIIGQVGLVFVLGFFGGILAWIVTFPSLLDYGNRRYASVYRYVIYFSVAVLLVFAAWFVYAGVAALA